MASLDPPPAPVFQLSRVGSYAFIQHSTCHSNRHTEISRTNSKVHSHYTSQSHQLNVCFSFTQALSHFIFSCWRQGTNTRCLCSAELSALAMPHFPVTLFWLFSSSTGRCSWKSQTVDVSIFNKLITD